MELNYLNSSIATTTTTITRFIHPTQKQKYHSSILKPTFPLKITFLRQPLHKNITLSPPPPPPSSPQQQRNQICNNNNKILDVLRLMDGLGVVVTPDIYASLVVECTQKRDAIEAAEIYTHMKKNAGIVRFLKGSAGLCLLNRILLMLVSCGCFDVAHQLFDEMPHRNFISLAIVMAALIDNHLFEEALGLFVKMYRWFVYQEFDSGLEVVLVSFYKACVHLKEVDLGKMVHGWMLKMGYDRGLVVDTALVEFYGKCGCLWEANHVFFDLIRVIDHRDTVLWTGVIVNNGREQCFGEVLRIFREMAEAGVRMNEYTFSTVLKACGRVGDDGLFGQQVHANAIKLGLDGRVFVMCALIDMYGKCGLLNDAKKVFDRTDYRKRNNACWNAMVTGFLHHGSYIDALKTMYQMKAAGLTPQKSVMDEVRLACGSLKLEIT